MKKEIFPIIVKCSTHSKLYLHTVKNAFEIRRNALAIGVDANFQRSIYKYVKKK
jgi:hypothetical protein